jgi:asparagine synthase (glutamine-hydrolysing)
LGEKPLYYGVVNGIFLFASELKALSAHPKWRGEINRSALALYMRHNCVPGPFSIFAGIYKLTPGTILTISDFGHAADAEAKSYWSAKEVAENGVREPFAGSADEAADCLDSLLRNTIGQEMVADVPLGAFLSGGIDSSLIVALMQAQSARPIKTFTIGFHEKDYSEATHAKAIAAHLGTEHSELIVSADQAMAVIPKLAGIYDEPFSDSSQIPTFLVSELARRSVTVSLSGDGGDEIFGGYNRYTWVRKIWQKFGWLPQSVREGLAVALTSVSPQRWQNLFSAVNHLLPHRMRQRSVGDKIHKLGEVLQVDDLESMYLNLVSHWKNLGQVMPGIVAPNYLLNDKSAWAKLTDFTDQMMFLDLVTYLPDDIMVKVDRASMAVSLEARAPFLDHRVVEFAWKLPQSMKIRGDEGKWILKQVLARYIPRELTERPKMGFGLPLDSWLRGPLRDWGEALLSERRLTAEGFFDVKTVRQKWQEHLTGKRNWQYLLWDVLMFEAWLDDWQSEKMP